MQERHRTFPLNYDRRHYHAKCKGDIEGNTESDELTSVLLDDRERIQEGQFIFP